MKSRSQYVGLTIAVACCLYLPHIACGQVFPGQGSGFPVQRLENGTAEDSYGSYPRTELDSIPFAGRYRNSCYGRIFIEETPAGIIVSVNGRTVRARDSAELRHRYPDAYGLYERTLGRKKRLLFERYAELKNRFSNTNRLLAGGDMPRPLGTNSSPDRGISLIENGKIVTITGTETGIAVSLDGKRVRAKNTTQLRKKFPAAFRMFEEPLAGADGGDSQPAAK